MDDSSARVVVVDDHPDITETLAELLAIDGYSVRTAHDADSALVAIAEHRPHCVLLDVHMPGGRDGCDLSRRLRDTYGDDIVLVAISGFDEQSDRVAETFERVDHYLRKPLSAAKLRAVLPPLT